MTVTERRRGGDVAVALVVMPELCNRLLTLHVADERGRCRACTRGGTGEPGDRWPCSIRDIAMAATLLRTSRSAA